MPDSVRTAAILSTAPTPWGELGTVCIDRAGEAGALHVVHRTSGHRTPPPLQVVSVSGPGERLIRITGGGSSASDGTLFQQFGLVGLPPDPEPTSIALALQERPEPQSDSAAMVGAARASPGAGADHGADGPKRARWFVAVGRGVAAEHRASR